MPVGVGSQGLNFQDVVIDPNNPQILYAQIDYAGLVKSTDGGLNWESIKAGLPIGSIRTIALNPTTSTLFVSVYNAGFFRSTDGGMTWSRADFDQYADINAVGFSKNNPSTIYAGGHGLYSSTDDGVTWQEKQSGPHYATILSLTVDPGNSSVVYVGIETRSNGTFYKSIDSGRTWQPILFEDGAIGEQITVVNDSSLTLFAGTNRGLFRSSDGGVNWMELDLNYFSPAIIRIVLDPARANVVYASTCGAGILKSTDGGDHWNPSNQGLSAYCFVGEADVTISETPTHLLTANFSGGVFRSVDRGRTWESWYFLPSYDLMDTVFIDLASPLGIEYDPRISAWFMLNGNLYMSTDDGNTWDCLLSVGEQINCLVLHPDDPQMMYVGANKRGVSKTSDGGASWAYCNEGLENRYVACMLIDPVNPQILFAGTDSGLYRSRDGGGTWEYLRFVTIGVNSLVMNPFDHWEIYADLDSGVWKSVDGGNDWVKLWGADNYPVIDPDQPQTVYAVHHSTGVVRSTDGGWTWNMFSDDGLSSLNIHSLSLDPTPPKTLYAGTGNGLFARSEIAMGDLNHDARVDDSDVALLSSFLLERVEIPGDTDWEEYDLNGNGLIEVADLVQLRLLADH